MNIEEDGKMKEKKTTCTDHTADNIEEYIDKHLPFSRFHILLQVTCIYLTLTTCWNFVIMMYTAVDAGWMCRRYNTSEFCERNFNRTFSPDDKHFFDRCKLHRSEWKFVVPSPTSFVTEYDLVCEKASVAALVSASYYIGGLLGSLLSGTIADNIGRKPVLISSIIIMASSSFSSTFVTNIWQLFGLNIIVGGASVSTYFTVFVYQVELVSSKYRAISSTILQLALVSSFFILNGIAYYVRGWRKLKTCTSVPCLLSLVVFTVLPESPRWLLSKGNHCNAKKSIETILKINGSSIETNSEGMTVERNNDLRKQTNRSVDQMNVSRKQDAKYYYKHLFSTRPALTKTSIISLLWFTCSLTYYTLVLGSSNLGGNLYLSNICLSSSDVIASLLPMYFADRIGRKKCIIGGLTVSGILVGCLALVPNGVSFSYYVSLGLLIVTRLFCTCAFNTLYIMTFEIFPTPLRSQGMAVSVIIERVALIIAPFLTRLLNRVSHRLPFVIICVLTLLTSLAGLKLSETNKQPACETYEEFVGKPEEIRDINSYDNLHVAEEVI